jgi:hypothetical protein
MAAEASFWAPASMSNWLYFHRRATMMTRTIKHLSPMALLVIPLLAGTAARADDICRQGFVWREAAPFDHVCVSPQSRAQARLDNANANARRAPNGGPYGPDTCAQGYVWRDAYSGDHVCVIPRQRDIAANENSMGPQRRATRSVRID